MSSTSATCSSSNRNDQRSYPSGGAKHAIFTDRASTSPVTIGATGGEVRCLRVIVA